MASEVPPSPPWWSSTQLRRTPAQGSWGKGTTLSLPPLLGLEWVGFGCAKVTPGPVKHDTVMVDCTPAEHLAIQHYTGIAEGTGNAEDP